MRDPFPWPAGEGRGESPEQLVRRHLDEEARAQGGADADALLRRVYARLEADAPPTLPLPARKPRGRSALAAGLVAAGLLLGLMFVAQPSAIAGPLRLVEEAFQARSPAPDRCYLVQVTLPDKDGNAGPVVRQAHLWTRGDRYRIDALLPERGSLGQDETHQIWVAPTPDEGARLDPDETPARLAELAELRTLRLDLLLRELKRNFDVEWDDCPAAFVNTRCIRATARGDRLWGVRSVLLEVEPESKIVRRLVIERHGRMHGQVRITLTYEHSEARPDEFYRLTSALKADAQIYGRDDRDRRRKVFFDTMQRFAPPRQ